MTIASNFRKSVEAFMRWWPLANVAFVYTSTFLGADFVLSHLKIFNYLAMGWLVSMGWFAVLYSSAKVTVDWKGNREQTV